MSDNKELIRELRSSAFVLDGLSTVVGDNVELDSIERDRISAALHSAGDALESQPPCGTDGAALAALVTRDLCESEPANPDDPDTLCVKVNYVAEVIQRHAKPAAPVAPAVVAGADGWGIYRAYGSKGELLLVHNEQKAVATSIDENNPAYGILNAMLAASQREGGGT